MNFIEQTKKNLSHYGGRLTGPHSDPARQVINLIRKLLQTLKKSLNFVPTQKKLIKPSLIKNWKIL